MMARLVTLLVRERGSAWLVTGADAGATREVAETPAA
jgi:hypothetical protein